MQNLTHQQIESRAYDLWQDRGCPGGSPETDWFAAEQELSAPEPLTQVAREVGSLVGRAVSVLKEITSATSQ